MRAKTVGTPEPISRPKSAARALAWRTSCQWRSRRRASTIRTGCGTGRRDGVTGASGENCVRKCDGRSPPAVGLQCGRSRVSSQRSEPRRVSIAHAESNAPTQQWHSLGGEHGELAPPLAQDGGSARARRAQRGRHQRLGARVCRRRFDAVHLPADRVNVLLTCAVVPWSSTWRITRRCQRLRRASRGWPVDDARLRLITERTAE